MYKINIKHLLGTCPIRIAPTLKDALDPLPDHLREPADTGVKTLIVTNETLAQIHRQEIRLLQTAFAAEADVLTVPDGESAKRIDTAHSLWRQISPKGTQPLLATHRIRRRRHHRPGRLCCRLLHARYPLCVRPHQSARPKRMPPSVARQGLTCRKGKIWLAAFTIPNAF